MLQTRFPRPLGDIGNPQTFAALGIPVRHRVVPGALAKPTVEADAGTPGGQLEPFLLAARALVAEGAGLITTSCGFLFRHQQALQDALAVPVVSSALLGLEALPVCGVLTIDARALRRQGLVGAGTPVGGMPQDGEFRRGIFADDPAMDMTRAADEVGRAALVLAQEAPGIETIVLECTNMAPYARDIGQRTGKRVLHIMDLVERTWHNK
jgi:hypothetical protein